MTPADSHDAQIQKYCQMSGHERLMIGLRLHELSSEIAREAITANQPDATAEEVAAELRRRRKLAYQIAQKAAAR